MPTRLARIVILAAVALVAVLYLLASYRAKDTSEITSLVLDDALECSIDPEAKDCVKIHDSEVVTEGVTAIVSDESKSVRAKSGGLKYPPGFEQFDTSDPNSLYNQESENFAPLKDSEEDSKEAGDAYLSQISDWVPYNSRYNIESQNPVIWQTYREEPGLNALPYQSWLTKNKPRWTRHFLSDANGDRESLIAAYGRELPFVKEVYEKLPAKILKLDFLRYLSIYKDSGVYADTDTECFRPIEDWYAACYSQSPTRSGGQIIRSQQPGLIVGLEFDVHDDPKVDSIDGQKVAFANYVFAANKGHPALAKMIHNIVRTTLDRPRDPSTNFVVSENFTEVYEWTGRKMWTDTIISHIQETVKGFTERDLFKLQQAKVVDDICILPVRAFGSGQSKKFANSPESDAPGVMVKHFFMHMWDEL